MYLTILKYDYLTVKLSEISINYLKMFCVKKIFFLICLFQMLLSKVRVLVLQGDNNVSEEQLEMKHETSCVRKIFYDF